MISSSNRLSFLTAIALSLFFASCDPPVQAAKVPGEVIAAESFLADIAQNVAGDRILIGTLIGPDSDPHEFQPRPADIARVTKAKVLLVNG
ncbi:MAG: zinc ABC transporter substrate-binding protein, partial [Spirochaetota bacterium]